MKQEDTNKFRCKVPECTKLFKGPDFWRKHVEKRHPEFYASIVDTVKLVNTYVIDPAHIAPSRSDANSNGHFPMNNQIPTGTPRGFTLGNPYSMGGYPMSVGMPQPMTPGMWTPGSTVMPPNWPGMATPGFPGGVGPMRNNGRNNFTGLNGGVFAGRMGAMPYMRTDVRGQRPAVKAMPGMPGFGAGMEGGLGAMGPREAVAGRQLRSYEDLDAADNGGKAGAELDY